MTYREALTKSMVTWFTEDIVIDDEVVQKGGKEMLSLPFPYFVKNVAGIMAMLVVQNRPESSLTDFARTMFNQGNDLNEIATTTFYTMALTEFLQWLLSQEIEEDETLEKMWYDFDSLSEKWNEFASKKGEIK